MTNFDHSANFALKATWREKSHEHMSVDAITITTTKADTGGYSSSTVILAHACSK
jgi:hypothetical protein